MNHDSKHQLSRQHYRFIRPSIPRGCAGRREQQHSQSGKQDVKKAQKQIQQRSYPQVVIPTFPHLPASSNRITLAGHSLAHLPQPTHLSLSICAATPRTISMAPSGQTLTQQPQATQAARSTTALSRFFPNVIQYLP